MAYSTSMFQAISILLFIHYKSEEGLYEYLSTRTIAEMLNIPSPTASKVLNKLNAAGLTLTKEGAKGGNLLARPVSKITLLDVFYAIEQDKPLFKTQHNFNLEYEKLEEITDKGIHCLQNAEIAMKDALQKVVLSELVV